MKLFTNEYQPTLPLLIELKYLTGDTGSYFAQSDNHVTIPDNHVIQPCHIPCIVILGNHSIVPKIQKIPNYEKTVLFNESILLKVVFSSSIQKSFQIISSKTDCFAVMYGILYLELSFQCSRKFSKIFIQFCPFSMENKDFRTFL